MIKILKLNEPQNYLQSFLGQRHVSVDPVRSGLKLVDELLLVIEGDEGLHPGVLGLGAHLAHAPGDLQGLVALLVDGELEPVQVLFPRIVLLGRHDASLESGAELCYVRYYDDSRGTN